MRVSRAVLVVGLLAATVAWPTGAPAGERADWGTVVAVGSDSPMLLVENDRGLHAVVVDPSGDIRSATGQRVGPSALRPGDHVDFAVSPWAGMQIADVVHVANPGRTKLAGAR